MNARVESGSNPVDTVKLIVALLLMLAGVVAFYWFDNQPMVFRLLYVLAGFVLSILFAYQTRIGRSGWQYLKSSRTEVRKMVWPTRQETAQTTIAVIVVVVAIGVLMWLLDILLYWAFQGFTGQGG